MMHTTRFLDLDCVVLENAALSLLVAQSAGPRIIALRSHGGENLFAELPDYATERPDGQLYHFYGGHRFWIAPESIPRTYALDDRPVEIVPTGDGLFLRKPVEDETGIEKSIQVSLVEDKPQVIVRHTLTNFGLWPVDCAPWAITQFKTGGVAILPQSREQTEFLPNRALALWPYTDAASPEVQWGNRFIMVHAEMDRPFKVGFPNPRGWLAYWLGGTLFVKRAAFDPRAGYNDYGSSSECYCNSHFIELETLGPIGRLEPGESAAHTETWELYADVDSPADEGTVQQIVETLGLE